MSGTPLLWLDQTIAARVRAHMPEESTIDLDAHAELIGKLVAATELARIARDAVPADLRQRERVLHVELIERVRDQCEVTS